MCSRQYINLTFISNSKCLLLSHSSPSRFSLSTFTCFFFLFSAAIAPSLLFMSMVCGSLFVIKQKKQGLDGLFCWKVTREKTNTAKMKMNFCLQSWAVPWILILTFWTGIQGLTRKQEDSLVQKRLILNKSIKHNRNRET